MKKGLYLRILVFGIIFAAAFSNTIAVNNDSQSKEIAIKNNDLSLELQSELQDLYKKEKITSFEAGQTIICNDDKYSVYFFDTEESLLQGGINKHLITGYVGLSKIQYGVNKELLILIQTYQLINKDVRGIIYSTIYDKEKDISIIGGKVVKHNINLTKPGSKVVTADGTIINLNDICKIKVNLSEGESILAEVDANGYFILSCKSKDNIASIQGLDEKDNIVQSITVEYKR